MAAITPLGQTMSGSSNVSVRMTPTLFQNREVLRAGWLKYIPFAERFSSDEHTFWVVFAVYDQSRPYLEFYQKRQMPPNLCPDGPVSKHSLSTTRHISSVIALGQSHFEFAITLESHAIRLAADIEEVMLDWIEILKSQLILLNILDSPDNVYSKEPFLTRALPFRPVEHQTHSALETNELYEPIFNLAHSRQQLALNSRSMDFSEEAPPPPYERIGNRTENNRQVTFREAQVEKLKSEMETIDGLKLKVRKKDFYKTVVLVDILTRGTFIAGWKQKDHPHLHSIFHIGDQLLNINSVRIESAIQAHNLVKSCSHNIEITVRRIPFGQVFCLKRSFEGEDLGLVREKGTAEITAITANSIVAKAGLMAKCNFYHDIDVDDCQQRWCLTEINNRPLNLFFKNNEVADRLNAIGKEISILVHPSNFVRRLRKQLKTHKNYKDFIVQ